MKDIIDEIVHQTFHFSRYMRSRMIKIAGSMPVLQLHAMAIIGEKESMTMTELSKMLFITGPTATALADRLVRLGVISRVKDAQNRKLVRLKLTPKGKSMLASKTQQRNLLLRKLIKTLEPTDQRHLLRIMTTLHTSASSL